MQEIWKPVVGYEKRYEVSDAGNVRSFRRSRLLKPWLAKGYPQVGLYEGDTRTGIAVHQLVLTAFCGPCPDGLEACHCNGIKTDNSLSNLRWDTRKSNHADQKAHGTRIQGERHPEAKLTEQSVRFIRLASQQGTSQRELARQLNVSRVTVRSVLRGTTWSHVQ